jgi:hypothetical protein
MAAAYPPLLEVTMRNSSLTGGIGAAALVLLAFAAALSSAGCGKDGGAGRSAVARRKGRNG